MPFIEIGGSPCDEHCAQIGPDQPDIGPELNQLECKAYIVGIRAKYGSEPPGCELRVKSNAHDFGTYKEVICFWSDINGPGQQYAMKAESGLSTWQEVGMWPPVTYDDRGRAIRIIRDASLWFKEDNPDCLTEKPATPA